MTAEGTPFDHRPDPLMGAALRRALSADGHPAFVARAVARAEEWTSTSWDAVLARWARVGVVAAALIIVVTAGYLFRPGGGVASEGLSVADAVLAQPADAESVVISVIGN
jgi:hypothetical protein